LLASELASGSLSNTAVDPEVHGSTGTGLDSLVDIINSDSELERNVSNQGIREAAMAADAMNTIITEAIQQGGLANDGEITASDVYDVNTYIQVHYGAEWVVLHGDDESGEETGFHLVQNDGAITRLTDDNAINTVADGIYHIGFDIKNGYFLNEDGNSNVSVEQVAVWLDELLKEDLVIEIPEELVLSAGGSKPEMNTDQVAATLYNATAYTNSAGQAIVEENSDGQMDADQAAALTFADDIA
ncbi:MAG: hypothetical protein KJ892_16430, partial [Gammaproteobacteria bacterium]|nr:hypothetical protein [Gammaproteobacteria bacterium]MBU2005301.1 hypothetical protein [Gammaproteobacteria bacterium]